ncbi:Cutinase [Corynebacterium kutscheri]|uniref:Cutinase n=1 Tax=Corynebacterium kutscheri TaxID=35755 RepID=A0A0F6TEV2_9CORY|nr:cutinase family protein [Corynebacterium kutscheri]AKE42124.1 Cutinase [Corynebacterium kutscheri]VEH05933.1 Cutinase [Corynebacterium kutscheri]VEH10467.1 Cutinase [Corynebacterium kutscheri]VEH81822.1 Cutinase [Corynebacterium kutscheri]
MKKILLIISTVAVLVLIVTGVARWLNSDTPLIPEQTEENHAQEEPVQPEWCPDVEFISAPGTWESSATDDPINPSANPASFMLSITRPLQEQYSADDVKVWTLPYTAQFRNINALHEMTYDASREEGRTTMETEMVTVHAECPLTDFIIAGFSQGAVIAGDVANSIGTGAGVIPAERIRGVALIADGRKLNGVGQTVGNPTVGVGAEIALQPLNGIVQAVVPGATMRGERPGGFGTLNDRVFEICAPDDSVCDAPVAVTDAFARAQALVGANGVHAMYATNPNVIPGTTTNLWVVDWAKDLINR